MRWRWACSLALVMGSMAGGCDDDQPLPAGHSQRIEEDAAPSRPTTQELLTAPRKTIRLARLPLTAVVPKSWSVQELESAMLLHGPAPHADIQITLSIKPNLTATTGGTPDVKERLAMIRTGAEKEWAENRDTIKVNEMRDAMGGVQILERQSLASPMDNIDPNTGNITGSSPRYRWTITYYAPEGSELYRVYELNFIGLTEKQFQNDREFLRQIVDSVAVDPSAEVIEPERPGISAGPEGPQPTPD